MSTGGARRQRFSSTCLHEWVALLVLRQTVVPASTPDQTLLRAENAPGNARSSTMDPSCVHSTLFHGRWRAAGSWAALLKKSSRQLSRASAYPARATG